MKITIKDIAKMAGVSQCTVSRILNGAPIRTSKATKEKILEISNKYNYTLNRSARALKTGKHGMIAVIAYDITDAFVQECISALEFYMQETNDRTLWLSCNYADKNNMKPVSLLNDVAQTTDGIIIISAKNYLSDNDVLNFWANKHLPIVSIIRTIPGDVIPSVTIDNDLGTSLLMEHLTDLGHKKIAFCYCDRKNPSAYDRYIKYQELIATHHLDPDENLHIPTDGTTQGGYAAGLKLINRKNKPTAIIGFNDLTAIGLIKACYDAGLNVPKDISIASFDNIRISQMTTPALTTVATDFEELAKLSLEELYKNINSEEQKPGIVRQHITKPKLITRESTSALSSKQR